MPVPFSTYITNALNDLEYVASDLYYAGQLHTSLGLRIEQQNWTSARAYCDTIASYIQQAANHIFSGTSGFKTDLSLALWWLDNYTSSPPYTLTMLKLLTAMAVPTADEFMTFIALTDAYKTALWDKSYNAEYYATFVRFFKTL